MRMQLGVVCAALTGAAGLSCQVAAQPIDFFTFSQWQGGGGYPAVDTLDPPFWDIRDGGATAVCLGNAYPTIFYDPSIDLNGKRITGTFFPGIDDDLVGFAFGYTAADDFNPGAQFWIIDWKSTDQSFTFADDPLSAGTFHDITPGAGFCPAGIRLLKARGTPTAIELWSGIDRPENDVPPWAPGGVEEVARANDLGRIGYLRDSTVSWRFDIELTPTNLKMWINGVLQFDLDAPVGEPYETAGFGLFESYQDGGTMNPDEVIFTNFSIADASMTPPPDTGLPFPAPTEIFAAGNVDSLTTVFPAINTPANPDEVWFAVTATTPANPIQMVGPTNRGDVSFFAGGNGLYAAEGVGLVTMRENRVGTQLITAEVVPQGAFGITGESGVAIAPSRNVFGSGNEANADFAFAYFPFAEDWKGGWVQPDGLIVDNPADASVTNLPTPDLDDQEGLYDVTIPGASSSDGLLFTCGASNEDNTTAVITMNDGWRVAVRDNDLLANSGPETFERDDFAFVYIPTNPAPPSLVKAMGRLVGFSGTGEPITDNAHGSFTLTRQEAGLYRLTVPGYTPATGMLILTPNSQIALADPDGVLVNDNAPLNYFLSYEPDGDDFLIQAVELHQVNQRTDTAFSFALLAFEDAPACACETDGNAAQVDVFDLLAYLDLWFVNAAGADIDGTPGVDVFDLLFFLDCWFPASAGAC